MLNEFKAFIARGNVMDLAVGVIIGAAFGKIVTSLTESVIMPVVGWITGGVDFTNYFVALGTPPADYKGSLTDYAALKAAGVPMIGHGDFITQLVNFLIVAWIIFLLVKGVNRVVAKKEAEAAPAGPSEVDILKEIRDELKKRP
ncbi:large conductance mechanosensitive channel protein MscL [Novosphingobium sp. JCM 18896]|uniref:large conductance mechanosensitive channel protein MscL n=1 Tax=Novosphingobium sp. JCM 18896 TaxID=2989731 RepID=UPI002221B4DD|nr:large conductance mechanosensitive channel protein MscL [Novosphingobium sp. JCM 18896]MCW1430993.1 large conductance mechanosensitive channel protein MscL [Novosphingobium sp. JCM 18896]